MTHSTCLQTHNSDYVQDVFTVAAPLGVLGLVAEGLFLRRYMLGLLRERNEVIKRVAEGAEWERYLPAAADGDGGGR